MKRTHRLLAWQEQALLDARRRGEKVDALAEEFGVHRSYPGKLAKSRGHGRPNGRPKSREPQNPMLGNATAP